jgi:hypothetical protein
MGQKIGILWFFNISVDPVCESRYHMDMSCISVVTETSAVSTF